MPASERFSWLCVDRRGRAERLAIAGLPRSDRSHVVFRSDGFATPVDAVRFGSVGADHGAPISRAGLVYARAGRASDSRIRDGSSGRLSTDRNRRRSHRSSGRRKLRWTVDSDAERSTRPARRAARRCIRKARSTIGIARGHRTAQGASAVLGGRARAPSPRRHRQAPAAACAVSQSRQSAADHLEASSARAALGVTLVARVPSSSRSSPPSSSSPPAPHAQHGGPRPLAADEARAPAPAASTTSARVAARARVPVGPERYRPSPAADRRRPPTMSPQQPPNRHPRRSASPSPSPRRDTSAATAQGLGAGCSRPCTPRGAKTTLAPLPKPSPPLRSAPPAACAERRRARREVEGKRRVVAIAGPRGGSVRRAARACGDAGRCLRDDETSSEWAPPASAEGACLRARVHVGLGHRAEEADDNGWFSMRTRRTLANWDAAQVVGSRRAASRADRRVERANGSRRHHDVEVLVRGGEPSEVAAAVAANWSRTSPSARSRLRRVRRTSRDAQEVSSLSVAGAGRSGGSKVDAARGYRRRSRREPSRSTGSAD